MCTAYHYMTLCELSVSVKVLWPYACLKHMRSIITHNLKSLHLLTQQCLVTDSWTVLQWGKRRVNRTCDMWSFCGSDGIKQCYNIQCHYIQVRTYDGGFTKQSTGVSACDRRLHNCVRRFFSVASITSVFLVPSLLFCRSSHFCQSSHFCYTGLLTSVSPITSARSAPSLQHCL